MQDNFEQLKRLSSKVHLEPAKKDAMRQTLLNFMAAHEALEVRPARVSFAWERFAIPAGAFALILLISGGTSLAAEYALPGDPLYAVKTKINEPLIAALNTSESAEANWHATVALRRLEEADALAIKGKLTPEVKSEIGNNFEVSAAKAADTIASLDEKGDGSTEQADDLSTQFESSLKAHAENLAKLTGQDVSNPPIPSEPIATALPKAPMMGIAALRTAPATTTDMTETDVKDEDPLIQKIKTTITIIASRHSETESRVVATSDTTEASHAATGKITAAQNVIASVDTFIAKNNFRLSADALAAAHTRLTNAKNLEASAEAKLKAGDTKTAFSLANKAIRAAQETRVLAAAQLQVETETGATRAMGVASEAPTSLNLLMIKNPQDGDGSRDIMTTGGEGSPSTSSSTLNVDDTLKTESP